MKNIVSFSGGKDSTAMLLMMIEEGIPIHDIIMFDTGWEFPEMYNHLKRVERYINRNITVIHPEKTFEYYMLDHVKTKGKNKGKKGYSWPDFKNRWCTTIKTQAINKYLNNIKESVQFIGIASDEINRPQTIGKRYYLFENGVTEKMALQYCYDRGFDWGGLYELYNRVSCAYCPLKPIKELKNTYLHKPEIWAKMIDLDSKTYRKFRPDYSIKYLSDKFDSELNKQQTINFKE